MKQVLNVFLISLLFSLNGFSQKVDSKFFNEADAFFKSKVKNGLINYDGLKSNAQLSGLIRQIENADLAGASDATKQAFYINAYNLNVINQVVKSLPTNSVLDQGGFFDRQKITVAGSKLTLNQLEKNNLLKVYKDARFHFVLVCGALGCPPITNFAYTPDKLEAQLNQQTRLAINDPNFIKVNGNAVELSEIFKWYINDFGGNKFALLNFINKYRNTLIPTNAKISYYKYDWRLNKIGYAGIGLNDQNSVGSNASRYIVSSTISKGSIELKIFNNLYSQKTGSDGNLTDRSSFFTTSISALYGLSNRFNIGLNTRFRKVRNNALPSSPFSVFGSDQFGSSRSGLTAIGPQIRYAPVPKWENFSIQSSFVFPIGEDLSGSSTQPFIDWSGATWNTQIFNDFTIGNKFSLFTEIDVLFEDLGNREEGHINRFSTPLTLIFSYTPTNKLTLYTLGGYSPYWQSDFDYFAQAGVGAKYQFTPNLELELLYTDFTNQFLSQNGGQAQTINLGFRINL